MTDRNLTPLTVDERIMKGNEWSANLRYAHRISALRDDAQAKLALAQEQRLANIITMMSSSIDSNVLTGEEWAEMNERMRIGLGFAGEKPE